MHEITVVANIIELAEKEARKAGVRSIRSIEIEIGKLSCIEKAAFDFAWMHGVKNTMLYGAERITHFIPGEAACKSCHEVFEVEELYEACPRCGDYFSEIVHGQELRVKSIRVEE